MNTSLKIKTCSVFGHSEIIITKELEENLNATFSQLISDGCEEFLFGGFGMFDDLCHKVISELKLIYPNIKRIFCVSNPRHLQINKRPKWLKQEDYEESAYLDLKFDWWYKRIYYRNCTMIENNRLLLDTFCVISSPTMPENTDKDSVIWCCIFLLKLSNIVFDFIVFY